MEYHYIKHSQICCFTLRSIVCIVVLQSQNCFHMWNLKCTSEKSSLQMNIPVRKCEVSVYLCQFFPVVSNATSNIHIFHGIVPKLKTVTTCWLLTFTFDMYFMKMVQLHCALLCFHMGRLQSSSGKSQSTMKRCHSHVKMYIHVWK